MDPRRSTPRIAALGVPAGILAGLFGVGGGLVLVPGMVLLMGVSQHVAHATSLVAILATAPAALVAFALDGSVAVRAGIAIAVGAVTGAVLGAALMRRLTPRRLRQAFALLLLFVAARMLLPSPETSAVAAEGVVAIAGFMLLGLAAGVLSALLGVGGGVIMVPAMALLFGLDQHTAEGTSLLVILPTALAGALRHSRHGYADWRLGALLGLGGIVGGLIGGRLALALPAADLQRLFALFLAVTAVRMLLGLRREPRTLRTTDD